MTTSERTTTAPAPRELAGLERAMRITEFEIPFNVVAVLRLEGNLAASQVRSALDQLQRRHPLLRARVVSAGSKYAFHFDVTNPIPLDVRERATPDAWIAATEETLNTRFDLASGPLVRCHYLAGTGCGDLLVTFHHMIVDAASAIRLFADLLTLCAGRTPADFEEVADEGRFPASRLFPREFTGVRLARAVGGFMGHQVADEMGFRWNSRGVRTPPIASSGRGCILPVRFGAPLTSALIQASRRHRVTLNAILGAGMLAAVQRKLYPSARVPLRHIVFADLRPRLRSSVPERMLGCFLTMFRLTVLLERNGDFWALATQVQDASIRAERSGERQLSYLLSPGIMKVILGLRAFRWSATALSYSGPPNLPEDYGAFRLVGLHAFPSNMTTGPEYSALARLFRGELWCDFLYLDCDMDAATAREIARDMQAILQEATC